MKANPLAGRTGLLPRYRHLLVAVALLAIAVAGLTSRAKTEPPIPMVSVPDLGGAYVEAMVGNPSYLNPILLQFNQTERDLSTLIFSGLAKFGDDGQVIPDLAEKWDILDGGKSYRFNLRRDVRWHDRTPFTADDVLFTVKAMQHKDFAGSPEVAELWRSVEIKQIDDYTVEFDLKEPFAPFLEYTTVGVLPRHLYSDTLGKAMTASPYNLKPVGTGPFKLTRISSEGVALEPFSEYYGATPLLAQLRFRFYPDYPAALAALDRGEVDGLPYVDSTDVARLAASDKLAMHSAPEYLKYSVLFLNNTHWLFQDKAVRQAVAYAIDKEGLIRTLLAGEGLPGKGPISPGSWAFDPKVEVQEYDPKKAQTLLEEAGWKDADGDGFREKDKAPLSFVVLTNDNMRRLRVGELIAEDLRKVGFKAEVQAIGWTDLLKQYLSTRTFVATLAEQWLLTADPDVFSLWHSSQIGDGGFNFAGIKDPRADKLLEEARKTVEKRRRQQLYSEFQSLWVEDAPSVVLYYPRFNWSVSRNVKGIKLGWMADGSSRFRNVAEWYVKTKLVPQAR